MSEHPPVVAISSAYGAGGSRVAPEVAELLHLPFVGRLVPADVATDVGGEALEPDEQPEGVFRRLVDALARMPALLGSTMPLPDQPLSDEQRLRMVAEEETCRIATTTGGVILGRGAAALLRDDPNVCRVRLRGPVEPRIRRAMELEGVDEATARHRQLATDRFRAVWVQRAYGCDVDDPSLYHLVVDTTACTLGAAAHLVADFATACSRDGTRPRT